MPQGLSSERYRALQMDLSSSLTPEDHAVAGGFLHFCNEWDGLLIDQTDDEFDCCGCCFPSDYNSEAGKVA